MKWGVFLGMFDLANYHTIFRLFSNTLDFYLVHNNEAFWRSHARNTESKEEVRKTIHKCQTGSMLLTNKTGEEESRHTLKRMQGRIGGLNFFY